MIVATGGVRRAAVAGQFYPGDNAALRLEIDGYLAAARQNASRQPLDRQPKAIIVPHAGTVYSGPVAACAYAALEAYRNVIRRVILLGPAHRVAFNGIAASSAERFTTPLGDVAVDRAALADLVAANLVMVFDEAHAAEHSLEVQLPFMSRILADFSLIPLVVGDASPEQVERVLERLWGGPETVIVVSSDLSHYHDYRTAQSRDKATRDAIEILDEKRIGPDEACGCRAVGGLLRAARSHRLRPITLDLRNSGDTAGPKNRVVGYGAWAFLPSQPARLNDDDRTSLLEVAARAIRQGVSGQPAGQPGRAAHRGQLQLPGASFVTLTAGGQLRGCVGSLEAKRPLVEDVSANAWNAAFADPRFAPITAPELAELLLSISVLGPPDPLTVNSEESLLALLRPGEDGLILRHGERRATFLPQVWESLPEPRRFLSELRRKAGLPADHWSDQLQFWRYGVDHFGQPLAGL